MDHIFQVLQTDLDSEQMLQPRPVVHLAQAADDADLGAHHRGVRPHPPRVGRAQ